MTDVSTPGAPTRLYSQTDHDERGNFHYQGDLYRAGDNLATLAARIEAHLKAKFPDTRFAITTEKFARGRKITAEIVDTPADLTSRDAQNAFFTEVRDQMERFDSRARTSFRTSIAVPSTATRGSGRHIGRRSPLGRARRTGSRQSFRSPLSRSR